MKTENKIIAASVILGAIVGAIHYVQDIVLLHETALGDSKLPHAIHEFSVNIGILLCFSVFGYMCSLLIAKQKQTERKLADSLRFSEQMLESLPIPVFYKDEECIYDELVRT
jgi:H+/Cl- antiporter ClcA